MNPTTTSTVDGARPWCFEVADETRREILADANGMRRAANRAVGTVDAIAHRFDRVSADRRMADAVLAQVKILRVLAYGWRPLCTASFEAIAEGVEAVEGDADLDRSFGRIGPGRRDHPAADAGCDRPGGKGEIREEAAAGELSTIGHVTKPLFQR